MNFIAAHIYADVLRCVQANMFAIWKQSVLQQKLQS